MEGDIVMTLDGELAVVTDVISEKSVTVKTIKSSIKKTIYKWTTVMFSSSKNSYDDSPLVVEEM